MGQSNIAEIIKLVDELAGVSDTERQTLKKYVTQATQGDDPAKWYVMGFTYALSQRSEANRQVVAQMMEALHWEQEWEEASLL